MHAAEARRCIRECDVAQMRKLWQHIAPHLPQPKDDVEALTSMHYARTVAEFVPLNGRAYSHRWLIDNGYPSGLPDRAEAKGRADLSAHGRRCRRGLAIECRR